MKKVSEIPTMQVEYNMRVYHGKTFIYERAELGRFIARDKYKDYLTVAREKPKRRLW